MFLGQLHSMDVCTFCNNLTKVRRSQNQPSMFCVRQYLWIFEKISTDFRRKYPRIFDENIHDFWRKYPRFFKETIHGFLKKTYGVLKKISMGFRRKYPRIFEENFCGFLKNACLEEAYYWQEGTGFLSACCRGRLYSTPFDLLSHTCCIKLL
jgi:hypothetical protein